MKNSNILLGNNMAEQAGLSLTLSETPKTGFLVLWPKFWPAHKIMVSHANSFLPLTLTYAPTLSNFKCQVNHTLNERT